jgi:hypothetical protein
MYDYGPLFLRARARLALSHPATAKLLNIATRTSQRWVARGASPGESHMRILARAVYPVDRALAAEIAHAIRTTLVDLGVERPPPPPPPGPPPPEPAHVIDSVVCAAADAANMLPSVMRPALLAAFRRARQLRLTVDAVESTLAAATITTGSSPAPGSPSRAP